MKLKRLTSFLVVVGLIAALGSNCSSTPDYRGLNNSAKYLLAEAEALQKEGKGEEAAKLVATVLQLHPTDTKALAIYNALTPEQKEAVEAHGLLGFNKSNRAKVEASTGEKIAWYIPDRIFDIIDQVSVDLNVGPQIGGGVWVTRAVQAVIYTGTVGGLGWFQKKNIGMKSEASFDLAIGPIGATAVAGARIGTGGLDYTTRALWFHTPSHNLYQEYRDYWGVGAKVGFVFVGAEVEYHPVEIVDFLAGLVLYDPMNDDYATTRRLIYTDLQKQNLKTFTETLKDFDEVSLAEYKKQYPTLSEAPAAPAATPAKGKGKK
ncbi:hypothetical protein EHQ27_09260 [Leptospira wolffii]|uniref:Lipoprotein n=1 Tax=Leptospira wolffii TaxID=409998 RepID=A0A2M9ZCL2_9LEPT|nr:hypothetical protein [Leptospira wolffii]PJZ66166.1 hypothetical protein CH371_07700 [Leptospira wolffii]TGK58814.1 hypothetical protein EHQ32_12250 [Leptospira wolffii]TGK72623.1 hypothetical protein EHQ27_09260 [Leptospira wolffii]TGK72722.1 hypothetical protein EHQ35_11320 [Leptospira wolffii]TGL26913.1 hypothetical protein EHQ57_17795 [Leptospira wolffii]